MANDKAAEEPGLSAPVSRRAVLGGLSLLPLAAAGVLPAASAEPGYRFLSPHQTAVLDAAARRLIPGPQDDPFERGHPGAHEARMVGFLDNMLAAFTFSPQEVHAGGGFTTVSKARQASILATGQALSFTQLLFGHTIEGMYAVPEYGGNANLVGWQDIYFPGDVQPRGYTNAEVEAAQFDPVGIPPNGVIAMLLRGGRTQVIAKMGGKGGVDV